MVNVLLVDDSEMQYHLLQNFLSAMRGTDFTLDWSSTYEAGFQRVVEQPYDVALIDYELRDRSGLELIKRVTQQGVSTPLILLTGRGDYSIDIKAMQAGAVDYLDKTLITPEILDRSLRYAIKNQQVIEAERRQRTIAEALLDTATAVNSTLQLNEVLMRIRINIEHVIPHDAANIMLIDEDGQLEIVEDSGYDKQQLGEFVESLNRKRSDWQTWPDVFDSRESQIIHPNDPDIPDEHKMLSQLNCHIVTPILVNNEVTGFINVESGDSELFTPEYLKYMQAFGHQAALAIRNKQAIAQAQELAVARERQRIARELHDAVSQTLFSASVIAETLTRLWKQNPDELIQGLEDLARLNRGALAEMRALLVELRPQALIETELSKLLKNLVNAFRGHTNVDVLLTTTDIGILPPEVQVCFYRVAQEALNNIMKYAYSSQVVVRLSSKDNLIELLVYDDGKGFDTTVTKSGHLGLQIMKERAESIQGQLEIKSQPQRGTTITLKWRQTHA